MASRSHTTAGAAPPAVCHLLDLGATSTEIAGSEFTAPAAGRSLWPILRGRCPAASADETFSKLADEGNGGAASEEADRDRQLLVAQGKLFPSPHECAPTLPADYEFFTQRRPQRSSAAPGGK